MLEAKWIQSIVVNNKQYTSTIHYTRVLSLNRAIHAQTDGAIVNKHSYPWSIARNTRPTKGYDANKCINIPKLINLKTKLIGGLNKVNNTNNTWLHSFKQIFNLCSPRLKRRQVLRHASSIWPNTQCGIPATPAKSRAHPTHAPTAKRGLAQWCANNGSTPCSRKSLILKEIKKYKTHLETLEQFVKHKDIKKTQTHDSSIRHQIARPSIIILGLNWRVRAS